MAKEFHLCRLRRRLTLPKIARSIMTRNAPTQIGGQVVPLMRIDPKENASKPRSPFPDCFPLPPRLLIRAIQIAKISTLIAWKQINPKKARKWPDFDICVALNYWNLVPLISGLDRFAGMLRCPCQLEEDHSTIFPKNLLPHRAPVCEPSSCIFRSLRI
jgi:hypothetical protein